MIQFISSLVKGCVGKHRNVLQRTFAANLDPKDAGHDIGHLEHPNGRAPNVVRETPCNPQLDLRYPSSAVSRAEFEGQVLGHGPWKVCNDSIWQCRLK